MTEVSVNKLGIVVDFLIEVINFADLVPGEVMNAMFLEVLFRGDVIVRLRMPEKGQVAHKVSRLNIIFIYGH